MATLRVPGKPGAAVVPGGICFAECGRWSRKRGDVPKSLFAIVQGVLGVFVLGSVVFSPPEPGHRQRPFGAVIRQRIPLYAKKLPGRPVGGIAEAGQGLSPG